MGLVSFELTTVCLGGHNSLSQLGTWKCRGYVTLWKYSELVLKVAALGWEFEFYRQ